MSSSESEAARATRLLESGSSIAGAAVGATIGLVGGPAEVVAGAAAGAALTDVMRHVGAGIVSRLLGQREEVRVGAALAFAGGAIRDRLEHGQTPRQDGFFRETEGSRSIAEEILEGVLLTAKDAYEERKLPLLGKLYAGLAFAPEVAAPEANHLLAVADRLTYRQLCVMGVAERQARKGALMRSGDYRRDEQAYERLGPNAISLLTEIYDLGQAQLLTSASEHAWIDLADIEPGAIRPFGAGRVLARLMELDQLPQADMEAVIELLRS